MSTIQAGMIINTAATRRQSRKNFILVCRLRRNTRRNCQKKNLYRNFLGAEFESRARRKLKAGYLHNKFTITRLFSPLLMIRSVLNEKPDVLFA
jgi:hypothetical protein